MIQKSHVPSYQFGLKLLIGDNLSLHDNLSRSKPLSDILLKRVEANVRHMPAVAQRPGIHKAVRPPLVA